MSPTRVPAPDPAWAYFLDLDGTLIDLAVTPSAVEVDAELRAGLRRLVDFADGAVAFISGRSIADLDRFFPELRLAAAGQHGAERRSAAGDLHGTPFPADRLDATRDRLARAIARHRGLLLEDKGSSIALHYRQAPRLGGFAHRLARAEALRLGDAYDLRPGKRVVEIGPAGRNKGEAIEAFLDEPPFRGRLPVFLGDDTTDEFGFRVVNARQGHSIKIGPGPSTARWRLGGVREVRSWLGSPFRDPDPSP